MKMTSYLTVLETYIVVTHITRISHKLNEKTILSHQNCLFLLLRENPLISCQLLGKIRQEI
jgi:hypothetical protein